MTFNTRGTRRERWGRHLPDTLVAASSGRYVPPITLKPIAPYCFSMDVSLSWPRVSSHCSFVSPQHSRARRPGKASGHFFAARRVQSLALHGDGTQACSLGLSETRVAPGSLGGSGAIYSPLPDIFAACGGRQSRSRHHMQLPEGPPTALPLVSAQVLIDPPGENPGALHFTHAGDSHQQGEKSRAADPSKCMVVRLARPGLSNGSLILSPSGLGVFYLRHLAAQFSQLSQLEEGCR